ncbi:hypothetical protein L5515_000155 [Caenorhabditis briggsae]|uniref:Uncharacterized protein n=1 Tax=Caenorhabditis briggsae TaxID=6238 RepID=A0AAE9DXL0_CAEBR|nr:hypothetical protein L5515_000155 [Caenorhabditis briggsae]
MKTLVLLLLLQIHQITCSKNSSANKEVNCHDWFPEPITYRLDESHSQLTLDFKIVDDLISDREINESNQIVEDYVIRILNMENGYGAIQDRVARKLEMTPCFFDKDFARNIKIWRIEDRYLTKVLNTTMLDKLLPISEIQKQLDDRGPFFSLNKPLRVMFNDVCEIVEKHAGQMILKLEGDLRFEKWTKILAEMAVFIVIIFMVISLFLFLLLICRITFTVMVHDQVRKDSFAIFKKANPTKISKNKSINYGELLDVDSTPQSIEGAKLFESNQKFNESVERLAEIMSLEFEKYVEKSCEKSIKTVEEIEKKVEKTGCWRTKGLDGFLEILNATKSTICSFNEEVKLNPIDKSIIRETAYSKWVEALVPLKGLPVIRNSSMEIVRSPMQIYLVFENPSKKLRPTILEHMLDMAVGIGKMAPIYFILSIYFMCILPIMMDQNSEDGGGGSDEKTPKIDSKSKS